MNEQLHVYSYGDLIRKTLIKYDTNSNEIAEMISDAIHNMLMDNLKRKIRHDNKRVAVAEKLGFHKVSKVVSVFTIFETQNRELENTILDEKRAFMESIPHINGRRWLYTNIYVEDFGTNMVQDYYFEDQKDAVQFKLIWG